MDLKDQLKLIADRTKHKENIQTEEATKNAFVMPFLQCLGYDVFNPLEVVPEFIADIGIKMAMLNRLFFIALTSICRIEVFINVINAAM